MSIPLSATGKEKRRPWRAAMIAVVVSFLLWVPSIQFVFAPKLSAYWQTQGISPKAQKLAAYQLKLWTEPKLLARSLQKMRASNAEWDFMGRSFLVWALANMALRVPEKKDYYLQVIDRILTETLRLESQKGMYFFLMRYARHRSFVMKPERSQFLDSEIALMMGLRRVLQEHEGYKKQMRSRIETMVSRMKRSPILSLESYPNEVWTFCNTTALAAIKVGDVLDGTDHSEFFRQWVAMAKRKLIHAPSGILHSAYTLRGRIAQGPEGSSIWMSAHNLLLIDEAFAKEQYQRAKQGLARQVLGFAYAREWPPSWKGDVDIDSGMVIPVLGASAGSSGLALVAAAAFGDKDFLKGLFASLQLAAFPQETPTTLRFLASNQVGDAVILYALVQGPLWQLLKANRKHQRHSSTQPAQRRTP